MTSNQYDRNRELVINLLTLISERARTNPDGCIELANLAQGVAMNRPEAITEAQALLQIAEPVKRVDVSYSYEFQDKELVGFNTSAYSHGFKVYLGQALWSVAHHILDGRAIAMATFRDDERRIENWRSSQFLALDLDNNVSVAQALAHPVVDKYAWLVHATATASPQCYKTRVLFVLDRPITDVDHWRRLQGALLERCNSLEPDTKCSDPARFYYGAAQHSDFAYINETKVLPVAVVDAWAKEIAKAKAAAALPPRKPIDITSATAPRYAKRVIAEELYNLATAQVGARNDILYTTARRLLDFEGWPGVEPIEPMLISTALSVGLSEREAMTTITSARKKMVERTIKEEGN